VRNLQDVRLRFTLPGDAPPGAAGVFRADPCRTNDGWIAGPHMPDAILDRNPVFPRRVIFAIIQKATASSRSRRAMIRFCRARHLSGG